MPKVILELDAGGDVTIMWYYICLVVGAVIGWAMCAICTVAKCEDKEVE